MRNGEPIEERRFLILLGSVRSAARKWREIESRHQYEDFELARETAQAFESVATFMELINPKEKLCH